MLFLAEKNNKFRRCPNKHLSESPTRIRISTPIVWAACRISSVLLDCVDAIPVGGCGKPRGLDAITRTKYAAAEIKKNRHPGVQIRR